MLQFQPQEHLLHSYIVVSQSEQARERLALDLIGGHALPQRRRAPCARAGTAARSMTMCIRT